MHPCMLFFGDGTKLKTACNAMHEAEQVSSAPETQTFPSFPFASPSLTLSAGWHLSANIEDLTFNQDPFWTSV